MVNKIKKEIKKVVIGHEELIDAILVALLSESHILIEGVPGVAKTTAVNAVSKVFGFDFKRIQFTPDLLPLDIIGNEIYNPKSGEFRVKKGAVFTNLLLADEINRAAPKVQSALLEAMAEKQVTIGEESFKLDNPFCVLATANPNEQEGTYTLPEALLDRFMLKIDVGYNSFEEELEIIDRVSNKKFEEISKVVDINIYKSMQESVDKIYIDDELKRYILKIVYATREPNDNLKEYIKSGVSPRGSIDLYRASKAFAYLNNKEFVTPAIVAKAAFLTLPHRIKLTYKAPSDNIDSKYIIEKILEDIDIP